MNYIKRYLNSKAWVLPPWVDLVGGIEAKLKLEYGLAAYQIKGIDTCNNIVANILPIDPLCDTGSQKVKVHFFQKMVILRTKSKGMTNARTCKHIFCPYTHPRPLG